MPTLNILFHKLMANKSRTKKFAKAYYLYDLFKDTFLKEHMCD